RGAHGLARPPPDHRGRPGAVAGGGWRAVAGGPVALGDPLAVGPSALDRRQRARQGACVPAPHAGHDRVRAPRRGGTARPSPPRAAWGDPFEAPATGLGLVGPPCPLAGTGAAGAEAAALLRPRGRR